MMGRKGSESSRMSLSSSMVTTMKAMGQKANGRKYDGMAVMQCRFYKWYDGSMSNVWAQRGGAYALYTGRNHSLGYLLPKQGHGGRTVKFGRWYFYDRSVFLLGNNWNRCHCLPTRTPANHIRIFEFGIRPDKLVTFSVPQSLLQLLCDWFGLYARISVSFFLQFSDRTQSYFLSLLKSLS